MYRIMHLPLVTIGHETVMGKCTFFGTDYDKGMWGAACSCVHAVVCMQLCACSCVHA